MCVLGVCVCVTMSTGTMKLGRIIGDGTHSHNTTKSIVRHWTTTTDNSVLS